MLGQISAPSIQHAGRRWLVPDLATLACSPLFVGLGDDDIARLNACCSWRRVEAGEYLLDERGDGDALSFLTSGHVRAVRMINGRQIILRDINRGEYFGELSAIDGIQGSAQILAITNAIVARMPSQVFRNAIHQYPKVCDQVLAALSERIRTMNDRFTEQLSLTARERLCIELLRLSRPTAEDRIAISPPPSHFEIAARIGGCRETVTKLLTSLEREGLISRSRRAIALTDISRLRTIAAYGQQ